MKQILWIAPHVPYPNISHAGGKNLNYYINYVNNTGKFNIHFIGLGYIKEKDKVLLSQNNISNDIYYRDSSAIDSVVRRIVSSFSLMNPFTKYYHLLLLYERHQLMKRIRQYKSKTPVTDIVILHWTAMGLLLPKLKKLFPQAKFIIVEEDVTYLSYKRKYEAAKDSKSKRKWKRFFTNLKRDELSVISKADLTVTLNEKDRNLLLTDGVAPKKVFTSALYIDNHFDVVRKPDGKTLLFYGAMNRAENYKSVIWFIDNVMNRLPDNIELEVVGSRPPHSLLEKANDQIHIRGFVEDINPFLSTCTCMVAPLLLGAGIKAKVLEAMSAGIPVVTNDIGIEGIDAVDNRDFCFCKSADDYVKVINDLIDSPEKAEKIGNNGKVFYKSSFDVNKKLDALIEFLNE